MCMVWVINTQFCYVLRSEDTGEASAIQATGGRAPLRGAEEGMGNVSALHRRRWLQACEWRKKPQGFTSLSQTVGPSMVTCIQPGFVRPRQPRNR